MAFVTFFPGGSGGGGGQDHFAPKYLVGNVLNGDSATAYSAGGFDYYPDTGNGAGIAAALAAANVSGGDVFIRPGLYNLGLAGAPAAGLVVPPGTVVTGSGTGTTLIVGPLNGFQTIFTLGLRSELRDLSLGINGVFVASTNPTPGLVRVNALLTAPAWMRRVLVTLVRGNGSAGITRCGVYVSAGTVCIDKCEFVINGSDPQLGQGGVCALFADGTDPNKSAEVTQTTVRSTTSYDAGFVATEDPSLFISETTIVSAGLAGVLTVSGDSPLGQVTVSECNVEVGANGTAVDVGSLSLRLVNSRLGSSSGNPVGAALFSTCPRGVVIGNQINGDIDTSGGTNHIIATNLISSASVLTPDPTDEVAHNIIY